MKPNKNEMKFIGITGGIGAGKSEILSYIAKHYKCEIYLADQVAHQVKQKGTDCYARLVSLLGTEVLDESEEINHRKMADRIFRDGHILSQVNDIVHPAVKEFLLEHLNQARQQGEVELFFVEAALLIETGYKNLVDEMWYIYATEEIRRKRLRSSRGYSDEKIDHIMHSQLSEDAFRQACDFVIDNSRNLEDTYQQIDKKLEAYTWLE